MSKISNVAVVGYGLSAKVFHIPLILALPNDFKLYGIVQRTPKPNDDASQDHPGIQLWHSVEEVYKDPKVDIVVITSIPATHYPMCKAALQAGKHVVVEKPFVPTSREATELAELAKQSGKLLAVYQNRRWDSDFLTLRDLIAKGSLGEIAEFETHFDRHRPDPPPNTWKAEDSPAHGALYDLGSHLIDQIYTLFGLPRSVTGFVGNQRRGVKGGAADSFTALLSYDGMLITAKAGVVSPETEQLRFWVRGTQGSWKKFHLDVQEDQLKAGMRPGQGGFAGEPQDHHGALTTIENGSPVRRIYPTIEPATYVEFYRIFARALNGDGEVPVSAQQASDVLKILEAVKESSSGGRSVTVS